MLTLSHKMPFAHVHIDFAPYAPVTDKSLSSLRSINKAQELCKPFINVKQDKVFKVLPFVPEITVRALTIVVIQIAFNSASNWKGQI